MIFCWLCEQFIQLYIVDYHVVERALKERYLIGLWLSLRPPTSSTFSPRSLELFAEAHQAKASRRTHVIITIITIKFAHTLLLVLPLNWMCRLSIIRKCVSFFNWNYCNNWNFEGGKALVLPLMKLLCCSYLKCELHGICKGFGRDLLRTSD